MNIYKVSIAQKSLNYTLIVTEIKKMANSENEAIAKVKQEMNENTKTRFFVKKATLLQ